MREHLKIFNVLLCVAMVMGTFPSTSVSAAEAFATEVSDSEVKGKVSLSSSFELDVVDHSLDEYYLEANLKLRELGKVATRRRANKFLDVHHYYQSGQTWSNDKMKTENLTIGSSGCCLTSFAMIQRYLGGSKDPGQVNTALGNSACPFNYSQAAKIFGYKILHQEAKEVSDSSAIDFIAGSIEKGNPVLVGLKKSNGSTHFVCAFGYSGTDVYIHDPASNRDYTHLSQYLGTYTVHRLYVFGK
ncbi:MAG: C39 family peptidase [Acetatifactor sp.]|nr:C39 family peptidase [Acetatifactor sp.]